MKKIHTRSGKEAVCRSPSVPRVWDITTRLVASAIGLGLLAGVAAHLVENESVIIVGPILVVLSIWIACLGIRSLELPAILLGISCLAFVVSTAAVVWLFSWSPPDAEIPILMMALGYSIVGLPLSLWIAIMGSSSANTHPTHRSGEVARFARGSSSPHPDR